MIIRISLLFIAALLVGCSDAGDITADFQERSVILDGKTYRYRVFIPAKRDPSKKTPVMLYLHGGGARGSDNYGQAESFASSVEDVRDKIDFVVVLPQCGESTFWSSVEMSNYALAALDQTVAEFNGDPDRLYLAGFSLGGYGAWQIGAANRGRFAALVPIAGGVVGHRPIEPRDRAVIIPAVGQIVDSSDPYKALATAIGEMPVWVFHGTNDDAVPVDFARKAVRALEEAGNKSVKYTEYTDDGHIIVRRSFGEPGFFDWLKAQTRQKPLTISSVD